ALGRRLVAIAHLALDCAGGFQTAWVFMGQTRWAEPWNRLGDWQASSESSIARKSSNLILPFYSNLRTPTAERTPPFERNSQRKRLPSRRAKKSFLLVQFIAKELHGAEADPPT
ncbi:MAG: hypothetical protein WBZ51_19625, partial [Xanthobacteraceae bacterium]